MNNLFLQLGLASWKPIFTALLLPPLPFFVLLVAGVASIRRHPRPAQLLCALGVALLWAVCCNGCAELLASELLRLPPALTSRQMDELRSHAGEPVAIIVLGGGVEEWAPEYGGSSLAFRSLERLRYGIWLERRIGWPVGFSGGVGWGQSQGNAASEAAVAQEIATHEWKQPLRWIEAHSRDTHENARETVALLKPQGVRRILLVTHAWHMQRAISNFRAAAAGSMKIDSAPIGLASQTGLPLLRWLPSGEGLTQTRQVLREWLGRVAGA